MLNVVVQQVFNLDCVRVLDEDGIHVDLTVTRQMMETVAMQGRNTQTSSPRPLVLHLFPSCSFPACLRYSHFTYLRGDWPQRCSPRSPSGRQRPARHQTARPLAPTLVRRVPEPLLGSSHRQISPIPCEVPAGPEEI